MPQHSLGDSQIVPHVAEIRLHLNRVIVCCDCLLVCPCVGQAVPEVVPVVRVGLAHVVNFFVQGIQRCLPLQHFRISRGQCTPGVWPIGRLRKCLTFGSHRFLVLLDLNGRDSDGVPHLGPFFFQGHCAPEGS